MRIDAGEARVLGALVEKGITTPDYYPLSINALQNACNQKSSRDPVMEMDEGEIRQALHGLQEKGLVEGRGDGRVGKYGHRMQDVFNFNRAETAVMCLLLLRGAQTPGELRGRPQTQLLTSSKKPAGKSCGLSVFSSSSRIDYLTLFQPL